MNTTLYISNKHLQMVKEIIKNMYPNSLVWAYGSRVNGDDISAHEGSDLDLSVIQFGTENYSISELREAFSSSNIPFLIDIFDYEFLPKVFKDEINKKHFVIYDGKAL